MKNNLLSLIPCLLLFVPALAQTDVINVTPTGSSDRNSVFVGYLAGSGNSNTGNYNVFVGTGAGSNNTTGVFNTFVGGGSGNKNTIASLNTFLGINSGNANTTGAVNTFLGAFAGYQNTTGAFNAFLGAQAGRFNATGADNTFLGYFAGTQNSSGFENTYVGSRAGSNATAEGNTFVGYKAGEKVSTGTNNTFVGRQAGENVTTGSNNIIVGPSSGTAVIDGSENVLIGYNSQAEHNLYNATAIGTGSRVTISNALILGNQVNVGIGTSAPSTRLEVVSEIADVSGLRLTNLTTNSPAAKSTDQFLTVNELGDVIKARYQLRINSADEWSDKVFAPTYQLRPLASVAAYVREKGHLPGVPSANEVVKVGVDLVKMNATLLEKVEELTLYLIQQQKRVEQLENQVRQLSKP
ncbi:hypothetical protein ACFSUS_04955 [Spirosoma soli]|uniref:TMF family protein n=1 Tax=Spirosoma soli TaxID=1770529 RepID=A0ABW5M0A4_9BACT